MADSSLRGRFVWHELLTTDPKSASAFFGRVVGWKAQPWPGDASYTLLLAGTQAVAGVMTLPDEAKQMGAPPHWLMYVGTGDVDDTAKQAASLGGKILRAAADIPDVGRFAVLADPQGAVFGIYKPVNPQPEGAGVGDFSWHELATTDLAAALTFYTSLFAWQPTTAMDMGPMGIYQIYGRDGKNVGGMFNKPAEMPGPPAWLSYIRVPDSKKTADMVKKFGGKVINGPMEVPDGDWIAQGLDPQGAVFAVHSVKLAAPAPSPVTPTSRPVAAKSTPKKPGTPKRAAKSPARSKPAVRKAARSKPVTKAPAKKARAAATRKKKAAASRLKKKATSKRAARPRPLKKKKSRR